jgi:GDPmannose 4,6-dehydratase
MKKVALITGITGQDGSYLTEILLSKGYAVHGLVRRSSTFNRQNIEHIFNKKSDRMPYLHYGDMTDIASLIMVLKEVRPDEIYNLAAQSHVRVSFDVPYYTAQTDALGVLNLLEAVRAVGISPRIYQASTSELFSGDPAQAPQNEKTPLTPKSPYGVAKLYAHEIARAYKESYGMYISCGILFNHESPRRGTNFVTRKVTSEVALFSKGIGSTIHLGNLDARRDWGYAPEYMEAAWKMLQMKKPDNYVIATGETHSIRELVEESFACIGINIIWKGRGVKEKGINKKNGEILVDIDPYFYRPNEVHHLCGDATKAHKALKWKPRTKFNELIRIMTEADINLLNGSDPGSD